VASAKPFFSNTCLAAAKKASRRAARRLLGGMRAEAAFEAVTIVHNCVSQVRRALDMYCTIRYFKSEGCTVQDNTRAPGLSQADRISSMTIERSAK